MVNGRRDSRFRAALLLVFIAFAGVLCAQPNGGGGGQGQGGQPPGGTGGPIDDGAIVFLIAVTGYLYKRSEADKVKMDKSAPLA